MYNDSDTYYPITTPYSVVAGNDSLITMLNGYDISSTVDMNSRLGGILGFEDQNISLEVDCYIESASNAINCRTVSWIPGYTFNISYIGFDILVVRASLLMSSFNGSTFMSASIFQTSLSKVTAIGNNINGSWLHYGLNMMSKYSNNRQPFEFALSTSTTNTTVLNSNRRSNSRMSFSYIYLAVFIDCGSEEFWSTTDSICQGCPDG